MKFSVEKRVLENILKIVSTFIGVGTVLPIIDNVHIFYDKDDQKLFAEATNIESSIVIELNTIGEVEKGTSFLVNFKDILLLVSAINYESFEVEIKKNTLTLTTPFMDIYTLPTSDPKEFPVAKYEYPNDSSFEVTTGIFKTIFAELNEYCGHDELRPVMSGVLFEIDGKDMTVTATDAHKLYTKKYVNFLNREITNTIIFPNITTITKNLSGENIIVGFSDNAIYIDGDGYIIRLSKVVGNYPTYQAVIPSVDQVEFHYTVDRKDFINKLKAIGVTSNKDTNSVAVEYTNGQLILRSEDLDYSKSGKAILKGSCEKDFIVGYNWKFLHIVLKTAIGDEVEIHGSTARANIIIEENEAGTIEKTVLLMPVMITN